MGIKSDQGTQDPKLRDFAQQENDYILYGLFNPDKRHPNEDPEQMAERNCSAAQDCFGLSDPLYAMALNTLGFVRIWRNSALESVEPLIIKALDIFKKSTDHPERCLESNLLLIYAKILTGTKASEAIIKVLGNTGQEARTQNNCSEAMKLVSGILSAAVIEKKLERYTVVILLNNVVANLYEEVVQAKAPVLDVFATNFGAFQHLYFDPKWLNSDYGK